MVLVAGRRVEFLAMDLLVDVFLGAAAGHEIDLAAALDLGDLRVERPPGREPRTMREQIAERDTDLTVHAEIVAEARDAIVEAELAVAHQHHDGDRGRQRLGQRRQVEDGLDAHRLAVGSDRAEAEGALEGDRVAAADHDRGAGNNLLLDRFSESAFDSGPIQVKAPL